MQAEPDFAKENTHHKKNPNPHALSGKQIKNEMDRHLSRNGRPIGDVKKSGNGKANWGGVLDTDVDPQELADAFTHNEVPAEEEQLEDEQS
jgi:hypothetical protein